MALPLTANSAGKVRVKHMYIARGQFGMHTRRIGIVERRGRDLSFGQYRALRCPLMVPHPASSSVIEVSCVEGRFYRHGRVEERQEQGCEPHCYR